MKIFIIYRELFDLDGKELRVGGIQTYILNLSKMFLDNGFTPVIYQLASKSWKLEYKGIEVHGIRKKSAKNDLTQCKNILNEVLKGANKNNDLIIWGTDNFSVRCKAINSISIQHGIGFDYIADGSKFLKWIKKSNLQKVYKFLQRHKSRSSFMRAKHKICVDYNYLNWIRTMLPREELKNVHVIPNFTHINYKKSINLQEGKEVKILFARRFSEERGVFILIDIIDKLKNYGNINFTISGDGPYGKLLHEKYGHFDNIVIAKYEYTESLEVHSKHHIAIIPTYGSEGTSLSLLEAMTSGCVPIASNVGGMTNIILDGFNGFLVNPAAEDFVEKLLFLIENKYQKNELSANAKKSVDSAFSFESWKNRWLKVISNISK